MGMYTYVGPFSLECSCAPYQAPAARAAAFQFNQLRASSHVYANLGDRREETMYELGMAKALGKHIVVTYSSHRPPPQGVIMSLIG